MNFSGFILRLIGDVVVIAFINFLFELVNRYFLLEKVRNFCI